MSTYYKPCPFCKNDNIELSRLSGSVEYQITCMNIICRAIGPTSPDADHAGDLWNSRPTESDLIYNQSVALKTLPRHDMKEAIQKFYANHPGKELYPSDVAEALSFDMYETFLITQELAREGVIS